MNQAFFVSRFEEPGAEVLMDLYGGAIDRVRDLVVCHWARKKERIYHGGHRGHRERHEAAM